MNKISKKYNSNPEKIYDENSLLSIIVPCFNEVKTIKKVMEGRPHVVDSLLNNEIDLVINTTEGAPSIKDSASIRQSALRNKIFCTTTMFGAFAIIDALKSIEEKWSYKTLQEINK